MILYAYIVQFTPLIILALVGRVRYDVISTLNQQEDTSNRYIIYTTCWSGHSFYKMYRIIFTKKNKKKTKKKKKKKKNKNNNNNKIK